LAEGGETIIDRKFYRLGESLLAKWVPVIIAAFIPGLLGISVNMDYFSFMEKKIPYIARLAEMLEAEIGPVYRRKRQSSRR
jgi:hypothetical protein